MMPAPKSNREKELSGNPSKRPLNKKEPKPKGSLSMVAPKDMTQDAKKVWKVLVASMPLGVFALTDTEALRAYCEAAAMHRLATSEIAKGNLIVEGSQGQPRVSPWIRVQSDSARLVLQAGSRLGLDPISRGQIVVDALDDNSSPFDGLIN